jgi:pimeloyl-ACP methyl ester carboxylesterase
MSARDKDVAGSPRSGYAISPVDGSPLFFEREPCPERGRRADPNTADRPAAVLTDGIGCDGYVWKYLRRDLAGTLETIHWHYPGHGRSPPPRNPRRVAIADLADGLVAVLDECGREQAVLFGHSMGVQVVLETYRRHPARVAGLVLLCGMAENPLATFRGTGAYATLLPRIRGLVERAPGLFNVASRLLTPTRLMYTLASKIEINAELLDPSDFMPYLRGLSLVEVPLFLSMLAGATEHSAVDRLPSIEVPVLVVGGGRDGFTPPELSRDLAGAIPGAELLIVEDGSHTAPIERPELVREAVLGFLSRRVLRGDAEGGAEVVSMPTLT